MTVDGSLILLLALVGTAGAAVLLRAPQRLGEAGAHMAAQGRRLVLRLPVALLMASFASHLIPSDTITRLIGSGSGWTGILTASLLGGFVPGGPMVSFPLAIIIWQGGAGQPQMVAFLTAWSVFAFHRIIAYELPTMGPRFVATRLASAALLPPLAGVIAAGLLSLLDWVNA